MTHRALRRILSCQQLLSALTLVAAACIGVCAVAVFEGAKPASADEAWTIDNFHADITIQRDASLQISEQIDVDFGAQQKHGIFRDIPVEYAYDDKHHRVYRLDVTSITDGSGAKWPYVTSRQGPNEHIRIGDPDKTVSGKQSYRIVYLVRDAMNAFSDHDELFWNVNGGNWPVPTKQASATVSVEGGSGFQRAQCYEGPEGSTEACAATLGDGRIDFTAARAFRSEEQMTVVAGLRKGVIAEPTPHLERLPRTFTEYFSTAPAILALAVVGSIGAIAFAVMNWWRRGRDRVYTSIYYLSHNPDETTRSIFYRAPVVVEYKPPDAVRPAEAGVLLDEHVDQKDITATIVDLAVRGYLAVEELPKHWFRKQDYKLVQKKPGDGLAPWERTLYDGLFDNRTEVQLSQLKTSFAHTIIEARKLLYTESATNAWFASDPEKTRGWWSSAGVVVALAGGGLAYVLGRYFGWSLIGLPVVFAGLLLIAASRWMPKRTAKGSEMLRRVLGFRLYVDTAETRRQEFNEQANIFAEYLPYAIVFGSVHKWANAFRDIDTKQATAGWYSGGSGNWSPVIFSDHLSQFSSAVGSTIASSGASGHSGFGGGGGGGAGGGGGGGGGGSW